jgi:hypothetical protein
MAVSELTIPDVGGHRAAVWVRLYGRHRSHAGLLAAPALADAALMAVGFDLLYR